jgi:hypothetical protein
MLRSAVIAVRSMPPAAGRCVRSRLFGTSDGMGGTARSIDVNGMGGVMRSENEAGRGIVVTGSGLDAADSGMVPSLFAGETGARYWLALGQRPGERRNGDGSMRTRLLADAEQGGRHRTDSGPAARIGTPAIRGTAGVISADVHDDPADAHELLR